MFSVHEVTWSKEKKCHVCCGSTHSYHKTGCKIRREQSHTPPGRASDPDFMNIQHLKQQGMNSREIAKQLKLPLELVNNLFLL